MSETRELGSHLIHEVLILSLTSACACNCVFCGLPDTKPHSVLSQEVLIASLEAGVPKWAEVNLTGGDPLLGSSVRALFPELKRHQHCFQRLTVCTAGVPAAATLDGLRELRDNVDVACVYVSLDGVGTMHDKVRRRPNAFSEVLRFLEGAKTLVPEVVLTCVVNSINASSLNEVAAFARLSNLPISYAIASSYDHYINSEIRYEDSHVRLEQVPDVLDFLTRERNDQLSSDLQAIMKGNERHKPCYLLSHGFLVTSEGSISICGATKLNVLAEGRQMSPTESWARARERRTAAEVTTGSQICKKCTSNCYAVEDLS